MLHQEMYKKSKLTKKCARIPSMSPFIIIYLIISYRVINVILMYLKGLIVVSQGKTLGEILAYPLPYLDVLTPPFPHLFKNGLHIMFPPPSFTNPFRGFSESVPASAPPGDIQIPPITCTPSVAVELRLGSMHSSIIFG